MRAIFFISFLVSSTCYGQWFIGGRAAATFSNFKSPTQWSEALNGGYAAGVTSFRQVSANLGVKIDLQYIQKGYLHKVCNTITDALNTSFLEVPLAVDYSFAVRSIKNVRFHGNAGIYGAYWLSGKYKTQGFEDAPDEKYNFDKNSASRFDFGLGAGVSLEYILQNGSLSFDVNVEQGIIDMENKPGDNTSNTNQSFIIGLSYKKLMEL